jgi:raffinose/stachyose/melibiose transport system substrate-binding protein
VVVAAVGLLAGCTSTPSGTSTTSKVTLTLLMQQTDVKTGDPTTWGIVQAFEKKYPNITVTVTGQPVAQHDQSIDAAAQSNTLPDMFWVNSAVAGASRSSPRPR